MHDIRCPVCGGWLMREPNGDIWELRVLDEDVDWPAADFFLRCRRCKALLGIRKIEEQMRMFT